MQTGKRRGRPPGQRNADHCTAISFTEARYPDLFAKLNILARRYQRPVNWLARDLLDRATAACLDCPGGEKPQEERKLL